MLDPRTARRSLATVSEPMEPVNADLVISRRGGFAIAFRLSTGQSWRLTPKAADVLEALQAGWNPEFGEVSGIDATVEEVRGTIAKLSEAGVLECPPTSASRRLSALALTIRPPHGVLTHLVDFLGPSVLFVSAALVYSSWRYAGLDVRTTFDAAVGLGTAPLAWRESWLWAVPGLIALQLAHEFGHALVLAGYAKKPVSLGIRFWRLLPQPFTDTRCIVTIPRRQQRVTVPPGWGSRGIDLLERDRSIALPARYPPTSPIVVCTADIGPDCGCAAKRLLALSRERRLLRPV